MPHPFRVLCGKGGIAQLFISTVNTRTENALAALFCPLKCKRCGVDAIAQPGRPRAVGKDVSQVASAARASHFNTPHSQAHVFVLCHCLGLGGQHETWPSAARIKFGFAQKKQRPAPRAMVVPCLVVFGERAGEWPLRALLSQYPVLQIGCRVATKIVSVLKQRGCAGTPCKRSLPAGMAINKACSSQSST